MSDEQGVQPVETTSADLIADDIQALKDLFPSIVTEGKIDFTRLRELLGDEVDDSPERYSFTWAGKRGAMRLLQLPSRATLTPAPAESVNFDQTKNVFVEGENLEVLKLLQKSYSRRVKLIYIDPPYNTGNDYIYHDDFADPLDAYLRLTGQADDSGNLLTANPETSGRFHSAWLSMMYPRLYTARQLLREDGFIVISIDDDEVAALRLLMNEVFGEENFVATLVWDRNRKNDAKLFSVGHEYMLVWARNKQHLSEVDTRLRAPKEGVDDIRAEYDRLRIEFGTDNDAVARGLREWFAALGDDDPRQPLARFGKVDGDGPYRDDGDISWPGGGGPMYDVPHPTTGKPCKKPRRGWQFPTKERMDEEIDKGYVVFGPDETTVPSMRRNLFEKMKQVMRSVHYSYAQTAANEFDAIFGGLRVFDNPKHYADLAQMVQYLTGGDDTILDFFAGSCSLAHAVMEANRIEHSARKFICVQLPEPVNAGKLAGKNALSLGMKTIADIGKERIRRVIGRLGQGSDGQANFHAVGKLDDLGFRVFRLSASNFRPWTGVEEREAELYRRTMDLFTDPLLEGWQPVDVIYEIALKQGYSLTSGIRRLESVHPNTVYVVVDPDKEQSFRISLDEEIMPETISVLALKKEDLFICRSIALSDTLTANLALQCKLKTI